MSLKDKLAQTRQSDRERGAKYLRTFKWPRGKTKFRLLPGKAVTEDFYADFGQHFVKNQQGKIQSVVGDRTIVYNEPCPVRDALRELIREATNSGDTDLESFAKDQMAARRRVVNIVVVSSPGEFEENKPVIAEFSIPQFEPILSVIDELLDNPEVGVDGAMKRIFEDGLVFSLNKEGSGMDTKYTVIPTQSNHPVTKEVIEQMTALEDYISAQFDTVKTKKAISTIEDILGREIGIPDAALTGPAPKAIASPSSESTSAKPAAMEEVEASDDDAEPEYASAPEAETDDGNEDDVLAAIEAL